MIQPGIEGHTAIARGRRRQDLRRRHGRDPDPGRSLRSGPVLPGAPAGTGVQLAGPQAGLPAASNGASFELFENSPDGSATEGEHAAPRRGAEPGRAHRRRKPLRHSRRRIGRAGEDTVFDGKNADAITYPEVGPQPASFVTSCSARASAEPREPSARRPAKRRDSLLTKDAYGGPQKLELDLKGKVSYGIKWGLNMLGLGALLQFAAKVAAVVPGNCSSPIPSCNPPGAPSCWLAWAPRPSTRRWSMRHGTSCLCSFPARPSGKRWVSFPSC